MAGRAGLRAAAGVHQEGRDEELGALLPGQPAPDRRGGLQADREGHARALEGEGRIESEGRAESQGGGEGARVAVPDERILTKRPQGKSGVSIEKAKYDAVRAAIVGALRGEQLSFSQMRDKVATQLSPGSFDGSISWYTECVKLDLEA